MNMPAAFVLIVDDDVDLLEAVALILEQCGYRILTATSGEQALEQLRVGPRPSLILFDLMMPGMNGWTLRQKLLDTPEYADIPAVVLSGDHMVLRNAPPPRCTSTLKKPVDLATLLQVVKQSCAAAPGEPGG
jgi:two-component system, chemotaxis family, chemotaxis protein CheY